MGLIKVSARDFSQKSGSIYLNKNIKNGAFLIVKADWCGHCRMLLPVLESLSKDLGKDFPIFTLDADSEKVTVGSLQVQGFPTVFFLDKKAEVWKKYTGSRDRGSILKYICQESLVCRL